MINLIKNDTFSIAKRLKEIDKDYFIIFDKKKQKFQIHNKGQVKNTYCLTLPFECLDSRTVDFVRKTRIENRNKLLMEMDKENEKLEKKELEKIQRNINNELLKI